MPESLPATSCKVSHKRCCGVLWKLGPEIQWIDNYVTDDKVYCVYIALNEEMVLEDAKLPANRVSEVKQMIDPTTAERGLQ